MRINLTLSWKGSVGSTGRNPAPRPTFKREKRKAEAIGSINLPDASFILKLFSVVCVAAHVRVYGAWYLEGLPGACRGRLAWYGFVLFFTLSGQGTCLYHTEAPSPRLQSQYLGKSTGSLSVFELSDEDFSDSHFFGTEM